MGGHYKLPPPPPPPPRNTPTVSDIMRPGSVSLFPSDANNTHEADDLPGNMLLNVHVYVAHSSPETNATASMLTRRAIADLIPKLSMLSAGIVIEANRVRADANSAREEVPMNLSGYAKGEEFVEPEDG